MKSEKIILNKKGGTDVLRERRGSTGFTLLEMLLVIAIIAILAGIVIVAINPARQIGLANDAQRQSDVLTILNAVHQYGIDNQGDYSDLSINEVSNAASACENDGQIICMSASSSDCDNTNLFPQLASMESGVTYISGIPQDPKAADNSSGYRIVRDSGNNRITVCAPLTEQADETIAVTR